jgi:hypothetical protein
MTRTLVLASCLTLGIVACGGSDGNDNGNTNANANDNTPLVTTTVSGTAEFQDGTVEGAAVSVFEQTPASTATSDSVGAFTLTNVAVPTTMLQWFAASANGYYGVIDLHDITEAGPNSIALDLITDDDVDGIVESYNISEETNFTPNTALGIVVVVFEDAWTAGDKATISANSEFSFTFDDNDEPVSAAGGLIANTLDSVFVFANVAVTDGLTVTLDTTKTCSVIGDNIAVRAHMATEVQVVCAN